MARATRSDACSLIDGQRICVGMAVTALIGRCAEALSSAGCDACVQAQDCARELRADQLFCAQSGQVAMSIRQELRRIMVANPRGGADKSTLALNGMDRIMVPVSPSRRIPRDFALIRQRTPGLRFLYPRHDQTPAHELPRHSTNRHRTGPRPPTRPSLRPGRLEALDAGRANPAQVRARLAAP